MNFSRFNSTHNSNHNEDKTITCDKGLIQLHLAYDLDFYGFAKGILRYKNQIFEGSPLTLKDLVNIASMSLHMNYLDCSVNALKALLILGHERKTEMEQIKTEVQTLKSTVINTHNKMVLKRKKRTGTDFRGNYFFKKIIGCLKTLYICCCIVN